VVVGPGWLVTVRHGPVPELEARLDAQLRSDAALTGLYGVNFRDIPGTESPWGFYVFVAVELALAALAILLLRRRGLL